MVQVSVPRYISRDIRTTRHNIIRNTAVYRYFCTPLAVIFLQIWKCESQDSLVSTFMSPDQNLWVPLGDSQKSCNALVICDISTLIGKCCHNWWVLQVFFSDCPPLFPTGSLTFHCMYTRNHSSAWNLSKDSNPYDPSKNTMEAF